MPLLNPQLLYNRCYEPIFYPLEYCRLGQTRTFKLEPWSQCSFCLPSWCWHWVDVPLDRLHRRFLFHITASVFSLSVFVNGSHILFSFKCSVYERRRYSVAIVLILQCYFSSVVGNHSLIYMISHTWCHCLFANFIFLQPLLNINVNNNTSSKKFKQGEIN